MPLLRAAVSATIHGVEGRIARLTATFTPGGRTRLAGSHPRCVRQSFERISSALAESNLALPPGTYLLDFDGDPSAGGNSHLDLPAAIAIYRACRGIEAASSDRWALAGELAMDGCIRPISGAFVIAETLARRGLASGIILPAPNVTEARAAGCRLDVRGASSLGEVIAFLTDRLELPSSIGTEHDVPAAVPEAEAGPDFADVKGHHHAKRALEVCAAGGHHLLMVGPPGAGKSMLARSLPGILPPLAPSEALEVTRIHSVAGILPAGDGLLRSRPLRKPHLTVSSIGLAGGRPIPRPGEVSLAHRGVLLLDDLPDFKSTALEALRAPLTDHRVTVPHAGAVVTFPAQFMLVATMNPCPCGHFGGRDRRCTCTPLAVGRYLSRVRGSLLDQIDLHLEVPALRYEEISDARKCEPSDTVRERVRRAREVQRSRFGDAGRLNADMDQHELRDHCAVGAAGEALLRTAVSRLGLSVRAVNHVLIIARTIADLDDSPDVRVGHVSEAIQYRSLDRSPALPRTT